MTLAKKGKNLLIWRSQVTMTKKDANVSNEMQLQNHFFSFIKTNHFFQLPAFYLVTASLDKLSCTNKVDFGKCPARFGQFLWYKNDSNCLDVKLKVFKEDDNKELRLVQNLTMREADFNQFMRLRNPLVIGGENFAREETLTPVLISTISEDMDEQLKLAHKVVDVVDRANRKNCVTLLWYNVDKPDSSYARVQFFARKKEDEMFQQVVAVK